MTENKTGWQTPKLRPLGNANDAMGGFAESKIEVTGTQAAPGPVS